MNVVLYLLVVMIWGSTWLAISYQLGVVDPIASISYRFGIAAAAVFLWCALRKIPLGVDRAGLARMALVGVLMFSTNFIFVYNAEASLTSGLVALVYALTLPTNVINEWIFLGRRPTRSTLIGGLLGIVGIVVVFWPDVVTFSLQASSGRGIVLAFIGMVLFSLGQVTWSATRRQGYPVIQGTAYAMAFGSLLCGVLAAARGGLHVDPSPRYIGALLYLALVGSSIASVAYLALVGRISAGRAGYASVLIPVVALALSTAFEGFAWTPRAVLGIVLILGGNVIALATAQGPAPRRIPSVRAVERA